MPYHHPSPPLIRVPPQVPLPAGSGQHGVQQAAGRPGGLPESVQDGRRDLSPSDGQGSGGLSARQRASSGKVCMDAGEGWRRLKLEIENDRINKKAQEKHIHGKLLGIVSN